MNFYRVGLTTEATREKPEHIKLKGICPEIRKVSDNIWKDERQINCLSQHNWNTENRQKKEMRTRPGYTCSQLTGILCRTNISPVAPVIRIERCNHEDIPLSSLMTKLKKIE